MFSRTATWLAAAAVLPAAAQTTRDAGLVVVTAERRGTLPTTLPNSVESVSADEIETRITTSDAEGARPVIRLLTFILSGIAAAAAQAHITLEQPQAPAGSAYKAVFRVGHGCDGSPTHTVSVRLPEGWSKAKPMPKAGWTLALRLDGDALVEVSWKATTREAWLDDAYYDEFVLRGTLPARSGPLVFKVLQQCERGQADWSPALQVLPAAGGGHVH
jgi:uncharacterized protein YcnI